MLATGFQCSIILSKRPSPAQVSAAKKPKRKWAMLERLGKI